MIKSPYIHSNGQWAARSVVAGFFVAPVEALPEVTVTDVVSCRLPWKYMSHTLVLHT